MQYSMFMVDTTPCCVWEVDLQQRNREFLCSIDHVYFRYAAECHAERLDGEDAQRAAIALRNAYHHGLETLFSLLCASLQAPDCVYGWFLKCTSGQLRSLVRDISAGHKDVFNKYGWNTISWKRLSHQIHLSSNPDPARAQETGDLFAELWQKLSRDVLDQHTIDEYNSIKHGFRVSAGGFTLAIGLEETYGVPAPPENMRRIGGSQFGTSFLRAETIGAASSKKRNPNFRGRQFSLNWNPESMARRLELIAMSIGNTLSFLRILNGEPPNTVRFTRPVDSEGFTLPWRKSPSAISMDMDTLIAEADIRPFTVEEINQHIQEARNRRDHPRQS